MAFRTRFADGVRWGIDALVFVVVLVRMVPLAVAMLLDLAPEHWD
jgi:hypothetical protein